MITRCILPAVQAANRDPSAMREIVERQPEACPHGDCSPGGGCRERVAEVLRVLWQCVRAKG